MIQVNGISKSYGTQKIFQDATFSIERGERIGVIGKNGHGKTTLFRLLTGEEQPDSGTIFRPTDYTLGYLSQHLVFTAPTVLEEACLALPATEDGWRETHKAEAILHGLGLSNLAIPPTALSGGLQVRLNLGKLLLSAPNLLLLDEPTNYLDIVSLRWLERFLRTWKGECMIITHDRGFMNSVITHTVGIHRGAIRKIAGRTEVYQTQLQMEEEVYEKSRINQEKRLKDAQVFIDRFRAKASKARAVQSRIKTLEKIETLEALEDIEELDFRFTSHPFPGKWLVEAESLSFGYDTSTPLLFSNLSFSIGKNDRIGVIGKNGKGKSTLLSLLAAERQPVQGTINPSTNLRLGYFGQTNVQRLDPDATIEEELQRSAPTETRTKIRGICGAMMFQGDLALKKIKVLSGGEKSRVLLGKLLLTPSNLLLLDEPSNHLDMESNASLVDAVKDFPGAVVIVTHSELMLRELATRLLVFTGENVVVFEGGYDDFLARIGWEEEGPATSGAQRGGNRKEARRKRAEILQRKSKELSPLKKRVEAVEQEIEKLELSVASDSEKLIEISVDGFGDDAAKLSRTLQQQRTKIEELFEELDLVSKQITEIESSYELMLREENA